MSTSTTSAHLTDPLTAWRRSAGPFTAEVEAVTDWDAPSPCEGWNAREVLAHVIDTEQEFLARVDLAPPASDSAIPESAAPAPSAPAPAPPGSGAEGTGGPTAPGPAARWAEHLAAVDALLADPAIAARPHDGAFGPTTIGAVLIEFYGFDLVVHRWDLARSQGRESRFDEQELALLDASVDAWGEHAYAPGIFGPALSVPEDADAQTRVLARMGRRG